MTSKDNIRTYQFLFEAYVGKLTMAVKFSTKVKLTWKRSNETAQIEPQPLSNGVVEFNRSIKLNVNMYYDLTTNTFLEKKVINIKTAEDARLTIFDHCRKGEKSAGIVTVDLAANLNKQVQVPGASIDINIVSNVIGEKDLDSMSQMTSAHQPDPYDLDTSVSSSVSYQDTQHQSSISSAHSSAIKAETTTITTHTSNTQLDPNNFQSSNFTESISKVNDVSDKIGNFVSGFSQNIKKELARLKQKNKQLSGQLEEQRHRSGQLQEELKRSRLENQNSRSQALLGQQQGQDEVNQLRAELQSLQQRLNAAEEARRQMESSNLANDSEKTEFLNQIRANQQAEARRSAEEKSRLQGSLGEVKEQLVRLKGAHSTLSNQLKATKQNLEFSEARRRQLENQRADHEQELQAAKTRLERVYQEMVSALKDII